MASAPAAPFVGACEALLPHAASFLCRVSSHVWHVVWWCGGVVVWCCPCGGGCAGFVVGWCFSVVLGFAAAAASPVRWPGFLVVAWLPGGPGRGPNTAEVIGWLRICRPGSIIGPQQHFMKEIERPMWAAGDAYRRRQKKINAAAAAAAAAAPGAPSSSKLDPGSGSGSGGSSRVVTRSMARARAAAPGAGSGASGSASRGSRKTGSGSRSAVADRMSSLSLGSCACYACALIPFPPRTILPVLCCW